MQKNLTLNLCLDIKKHAKAFDANGDGKADMVACPPGWGCEKVITGHFNELKLGEFINPIKAEYSASLADLAFQDIKMVDLFYIIRGRQTGSLRRIKIR